MASHIETVLDAIMDSIESITPDTRSNVPFKRWRGEKQIEEVPLPMRERGFQIRFGSSQTPRTLSSPTIQWQRVVLKIVVGYSLNEPRSGDSAGIGIHLIPFSDGKQIMRKLVYGDALSAVANCKRLVHLGRDDVGETSHTWSFDLEWAETIS